MSHASIAAVVNAEGSPHEGVTVLREHGNDFDHASGHTAPSAWDPEPVLADDDEDLDERTRTMTFDGLSEPASTPRTARSTATEPGRVPEGVPGGLGDAVEIAVPAETSADVANATALDPPEPRDHLARIKRERRVAIAMAKGVVAARRHIDAARARLGGDWDLAYHDVEDAAWDLALEGRDADALAAQRQDDLDALGEDEDASGRELPCNDPRVIAVHAKYELARKLGGVLGEIQEVDERDVDEIASDLRARLSNDGETMMGARRALARTIARYRTATALRVHVEACGRLVENHLSAWPVDERGVEKGAVHAIVFAGG